MQNRLLCFHPIERLPSHLHNLANKGWHAYSVTLWTLKRFNKKGSSAIVLRYDYGFRIKK